MMPIFLLFKVDIKFVLIMLYEVEEFSGFDNEISFMTFIYYTVNFSIMIFELLKKVSIWLDSIVFKSALFILYIIFYIN